MFHSNRIIINDLGLHKYQEVDGLTNEKDSILRQMLLEIPSVFIYFF